MKYLQVILGILVIASLMGGCTIGQRSEPDYAAFFRVYAPPMEDSGETLVLAVAEDYVLVRTTGMGAGLTLYQVEVQADAISVLGYAPGEDPMSPSITLFHLETEDGQHIYFGGLDDWQFIPPPEDYAMDTPWSLLRMISQAGTAYELEVDPNGGFLCILDAPLADFQGLDANGQKFMDLETYFTLGYQIPDLVMWEPGKPGVPRT